MFTTMWEQEIAFYDLRCALGFKRAEEATDSIGPNGTTDMPRASDDEMIRLRASLARDEGVAVWRKELTGVKWKEVGCLANRDLEHISAWSKWPARPAAPVVEGEACAPA